MQGATTIKKTIRYKYTHLNHKKKLSGKSGEKIWGGYLEIAKIKFTFISNKKLWQILN